MILAVGLLAAIAAALLAGAARGPAFGRDGGWGERWSYGPGTFAGLLTRLGRPLVGRRAPRSLRSLVRELSGFLLCREDAAAGLVVLVGLLAGSAALCGWKVGALLLVAWLIRVRGQDRDRAADARRSWEVEMCRTLQQIRLQLAAGRTLQAAVEGARTEARGVAAPILTEIAGAWSSGSDSGHAFQEVARRAPDAATASFFSRVATAARTGDPLLPVLDAEIDRLRAARRARLDAELQRLPTQLVLFRGLMMLAAIGPIASFVMVMMDGVKTIF